MNEARTMYVLTRRESRSGSDEVVAVYADLRRALDGRKGVWRKKDNWHEEGNSGTWTTANPRYGSEWISTRTGSATRYIYNVVPAPLVGE